MLVSSIIFVEMFSKISLNGVISFVDIPNSVLLQDSYIYENKLLQKLQHLTVVYQ